MTGTRGDDNRLRQFWKQWRNMMGFERTAGHDAQDAGAPTVR